ncbi:MAG: FtsX-like permease family protein [Candidatus Moranbacteria bacterium]|nr:FtsX-like permease family protein [Candidatus Moranbacteria bacterium]
MFHELSVSIKLAFSNLRGNPGRTVLTLFGIVIGITSVIIISASGQGLRTFVMSQVETFGSDYVQVEPRVPSPERLSGHMSTMTIQITTLKISDAEAAAKLPNIEDVYAGSIGQAIVNYRDTNKRILLLGAGAHAPNVDAGLKVAEGSFYTDADDKDLAQVAVIGPEVKETLFGPNENAIGKNIKIKGQNYRIIGVLGKRGSVAFFNFDSIIYVPVRTLQKKIMGIEHITFFTSKMKDLSKLDETLADMTDLMSQRHKISDPAKYDFIVSSAKEARDILNSVFSSINILLLALTSISLVVGGVGIMNVMYVAVAERTFEIGLRKAVGARSGQILRQFMLEAVFITLAGGAAGIILGYFFSLLLTYVSFSFGYNLEFAVTLNSILLAVSFAATTGIIFGFYPALKASKLSPMEAIRHG